MRREGFVRHMEKARQALSKLPETSLSQILGENAEELEYDSMLMGDHIVIPKRITTPWPYDEYVKGKPPYAVYTELAVLDPFDTVAFLAAATREGSSATCGRLPRE